MEHVIVRSAVGVSEIALAQEWATSTPDGDLLDLDVFNHRSTILLGALRTGMLNKFEARDVAQAHVGYLPVQQPLMLENLIFRPGLTDRERSVIISRLTERAVGEAFDRGAGELYFLCRHPETIAFAEHHKWTRIDGEQGLGLKVFRLNLREQFGT